MADTVIKVLHTIPGRMRMEVPLLKGHSSFGSALKERVQALNGVETVRVNRLAHSIAIQYNQATLSPTDLQQQLADVIASLDGATSETNREVKREAAGSLQPLPGYTPINLTPYEATQLAVIQQWRQQPIPWFSELLGHLLVALKGLLTVLFPAHVLEKIGKACESATDNWHNDWQDLQAIAQVNHYLDLRQATLEKCDQLAHHVRDRALLTATSGGGVTGLFDIFGEVVDDGLTLVLALRTIHDIGLCYGYAPQTDREKAFAWAVFKAGIAQTQAERQTALLVLYDMHQALNASQLEQEALEESLEGDADQLLVGSTIEQGLSQLTEETVGGVVPVLGIALSIWADRNLIGEVSEAAQREFQLRWLLGNQKIRLSESMTEADAADQPEETQADPADQPETVQVNVVDSAETADSSAAV